MAQTGFTLSDEGRTLSVTNDSGTTAIYAGDLCYSAANDDKLTATAASARNAYAESDVTVKSITCSATGYKTILGIALEDIPASGHGVIAMEGVFIHQVQANVEAGNLIRATAATASELVALAGATTTVTEAVFENTLYKIGRAITGGSADGKYIAWKLSL